MPKTALDKRSLTREQLQRLAMTQVVAEFLQDFIALAISGEGEARHGGWTLTWANEPIRHIQVCLRVSECSKLVETALATRGHQVFDKNGSLMVIP